MKPEIKKLNEKLERKLSARGISLRKELYDSSCTNPELWRKSACQVLYSPADNGLSIRVIVYYPLENPALYPIVLAHEVGHCMTEDIKANAYSKAYNKNPVPFEAKASAWALHWFRKQGCSREDLQSIKAIYKRCLENYKQAFQLVNEVQS